MLYQALGLATLMALAGACSPKDAKTMTESPDPATAPATTPTGSPNVAAAAQQAAGYQRVTLNQGGCFGTCPVYTLTFQPDGAAFLDGRRYADPQGKHAANVDPATRERLNALVGQVLAKADELPREIDSGIMDAATSKIAIETLAGDTIAFAGTTEFAEGVAELRRGLFAVYGESLWQRREGDEGDMPNRLLVTLQAADQVDVVTEDFYRQQLRALEMVSKSPPTFLMQFDAYAMSAEEMLRELRRKDMVVKAEIATDK